MTCKNNPSLHIEIADGYPSNDLPYEWRLMTAAGTVLALSKQYYRKGDRNRWAQFIADELGLTILRSPSG